MPRVIWTRQKELFRVPKCNVALGIQQDETKAWQEKRNLLQQAHFSLTPSTLLLLVLISELG
jgi:hypothetical protein